MLDTFLKLRNLHNSVGFFEFHRDGYRTLEFSFLANRGGRFVEVTEYHSGTQRGSIRIPEGRRGVGWSVFEFQVCKYFLGDIMKTLVAQAIPRRDSDEGVAAVGIRESRNGKLRHFRQLRESRSSKFVPDLQQSFPLRNLRG
jgi:hypothetical protein